MADCKSNSVYLKGCSMHSIRPFKCPHKESHGLKLAFLYSPTNVNAVNEVLIIKFILVILCN
jgi:hypothetical protein